MITKEQLKNEIDKVENKAVLELVYQLIQHLKKSTAEKSKHSKTEQEKAMAEFSVGFDDIAIDSVEESVRFIRKGRRRLWDDI
jgi:soluble cytochrome b562